MTKLAARPVPKADKTLTANSHDDKARGRFMALAAALLGWMFDGAEMGIFSLVGRAAIQDLMISRHPQLDPAQVEGTVGLWYSVIVAAFLVGAATGGVLFGWLGDRIGRVRAMTLSVFTYALFTGLGGFAGEAWQVGVLRFIAALGMGGEWSLGVALVMEVWPNRSRAFMAGLIGAAANFGYLLVGVLGLVLLQVLASLGEGMQSIGISADTANWLVAHKGWRLMMIAGTLPALLTFFIRIFVPESEKWQHAQEKGTTSHWATQDLLVVLLGLIGPALIVYLWAFEATRLPGSETDLFAHSWLLRAAGTLVGLAIALYGYTYPVIRYFQRQAPHVAGHPAAWRGTLQRMLLGACLSGVALLGTWGATQSAPSWVDKLNDAEFAATRAELISAGKVGEAEKLVRPAAREWTLIWLSIGAIVGTIGAAFMGDWMGRRPAYCLLCFLSMVTAWGLYLFNNSYGPTLLAWTFVVGALSASFYGWLPLYLPELFGTSVRATGQGFSFNFGRVLAAIGVLQMGSLIKIFNQDVVFAGITIPAGFPLACSVICLVYIVGMVIIWFAPETKGQPLPD